MTKKPNEPRDPTDTSHHLYDPTEDPTHRFYLGSETEGEQKPDQPDPSAYKVGPGFPPNEHKWKKGGPSPYPKGRPKKEIVMTKAALGIQHLVNLYAKGDRYARRDLFQYAAQLGVDLHAKDLITEALGIDNQAIVDAAFVRYQQQLSQQPTQADHVKAPPELIDDDVAKPEPNELPAASPRRKAPAMPLEPGLDEHGKQKPRDRAFIQTQREWNLALQKKNQEES